jgi:hypothetical protein
MPLVKAAKTNMEVFIMAEIKEPEKTTEEGELADETLDVSGGVGQHASYSDATFFRVDPGKASINAVSEKRENC